MAAKKGLKRGFTLVELMIVVAIIGVLAALAIYGVRKYIANAKTAEARTALGAIGKAAGSAYDRDNMAGGIVTLKGTAVGGASLCNDATAVPANTSKIQGKKYQSTPDEWGGSQTAGWQCLKFSMKDPQYYQYGYDVSGVSGADKTMDAVAHGDLNGDGNLSTFLLEGKIQKDTANNELVFTLAASLLETDPEE